MPFKSQAQRRWMYANEPEMAERWSDHTSDHKSLPEKAKKKKREKKAALAALCKMAAISPGDYEVPSGIREWSSLPSFGASVGAGLGSQAALSAYMSKVMPHLVSHKPANHGFRLDPMSLTPDGKHVFDPHGIGLKPYTPGSPRTYVTSGKPTADIEKLREVLNTYARKPGRHLPTVYTDTSAAARDFVKQEYPAIHRGKKGGALGRLFGSLSDKLIRMAPAAYLPAKRGVVSLTSGAASDPHILAHELGHSTQHNLLKGILGKGLRVGGAATALAGNMGVLGTDDSARARDYALLSNAGALPTLGIEAHASGKGSQLMKEVAKNQGTWDRLKGLSKLKYRLGAWKGLPTYAALGIGMPWLTYAIKKSLGGYGKPE